MATKFLSSSGWAHIFDGKDQVPVVWVLKRSTDSCGAKIMAAQIDWDGSGYVPASWAETRDLEDSLINGSDVEENIVAFGLDELDELPEWAAQPLVMLTSSNVLNSRIDRIAEFYAGESSFHSDDVLSDGASVHAAISEVLAHPALNDIEDRYEIVIAALLEISRTWDAGFDMASSEDFVTDDETIGDILSSFVNNQSLFI